MRGMGPDWNQTMPLVDLLVGTPVCFRSGQEPPGFPCSGKSMFVRPWGDEDNGMCMVVDEAGTSMPVTEACLMVDLEHPSCPTGRTRQDGRPSAFAHCLT